MGSLMPDDSTTTASKRAPAPPSHNASSSLSRSSRSVQQIQPLDNSTTRSVTRVTCTALGAAWWEEGSRDDASTFTSAMSFTIIPKRRPSRLSRRWERSVDLPEPRKPERMVTGTGRAAILENENLPP